MSHGSNGHGYASNGHGLAPRSEAEAERALTAQPLTLGYRPSALASVFAAFDEGGRFGAQSAMIRDVEAMLSHPDIYQPYDYYRSGIARVKFTVRAATSEHAQFVHDLLTRLWRDHLNQLQLCYDYGWCGYELVYEDDGLLRFAGLSDLHPLDCWALTRRGHYVGVRLRAGSGGFASDVTMSGATDLWGAGRWPAKGLWLTHNRRWDRFYGRSQLYGAWRPWRRLAGRDGAEEVIDGGVYRFAYQGPEIRYPAEDFKKAGGELDYDAARDVARQMAEQAKAGFSVALPGTRDPQGEYKWTIRWPDRVINVDSLLGYEASLQKQCSRGVGVPPELIEASDTGSGWSGRKVPLLGFYTGQQKNADNFVRELVKQVAQPLLRWNYGPEAWCEAECELDLPPAITGEQPKEQASPGGQVPGGQPSGGPQQEGAPPGPPDGPGAPGDDQQPPGQPPGGGLAALLGGNGREMSAAGERRRYASTQLDLEQAGYLRSQGSPLDSLRKLAANIPETDLAPDGREDEPHITVKYGLHADDPEAVRHVVAHFGPVRVRLGGVSVFPTSESGGADVVKVDVEGEDLHRLNRLIAERLPCTDTHPTYQPHITLAYVRPGAGRKYAGVSGVEGMELSFDGLVFSDQEKKKTAIPLLESRRQGFTLSTESSDGPVGPDAVLDEIASAVRKLGRSARADLLARLATAGMNQVLTAARDWADSWAPELTTLLRDASLAAAVSGMADLADRLEPEGGPLPVGTPDWLDRERPALPLVKEAAARLSSMGLLALPGYLTAGRRAEALAAGAASLATDSVLARVREALTRAVETGGTLAEFRHDLGEALSDTAVDPAHAETIFRSNVMAAYADGQERLLSDPAVGGLFPYRAYEATHDDRVRPEHLAMEGRGIDGTNVYRADDPVWQLFRPPWSFNCRCVSIPLSIEEAARRGVPEAAQWLQTGREPMVKAWVEMPAVLPPEQFRRPAGLELSALLAEPTAEAMADEVLRIVEGSL